MTAAAQWAPTSEHAALPQRLLIQALLSGSVPAPLPSRQAAAAGTAVPETAAAAAAVDGPDSNAHARLQHRLLMGLSPASFDAVWLLLRLLLDEQALQPSADVQSVPTGGSGAAAAPASTAASRSEVALCDQVRRMLKHQPGNLIVRVQRLGKQAEMHHMQVSRTLPQDVAQAASWCMLVYEHMALSSIHAVNIKPVQIGLCSTNRERTFRPCSSIHRHETFHTCIFMVHIHGFLCIISPDPAIPPLLALFSQVLSVLGERPAAALNLAELVCALSKSMGEALLARINALLQVRLCPCVLDMEVTQRTLPHISSTSRVYLVNC